MYMYVRLYLVDQKEKGLGQTAVFLCQETISPLLLLQDLLLALLQVLHVVAALLVTECIHNLCFCSVFTTRTKHSAPKIMCRDVTRESLKAPRLSCFSKASAWFLTSSSYARRLPCKRTAKHNVTISERHFQRYTKPHVDVLFIQLDVLLHGL